MIKIFWICRLFSQKNPALANYTGESFNTTYDRKMAIVFLFRCWSVCFFLLKIVAAQALDKSRHEWHVCGPVQHLHKSPDRLNWLWGGQVQRSIPVDYKSIKRDTRQQILKENSLMARYFICFS